MSDSEKKIKYLVADTTTFINNVQLNNYAENIITVPDVVNEVKNKRQIRRLVVLPFDLQVREPDADCVSHVTKFSKKTGDYPSLSAIDLKVIALTYQLEKQYVGTDHLRQEPIYSKVIASKTKPEELEDKTILAGFYNPKKGKDRMNSETNSNVSETSGHNIEDDLSEPEEDTDVQGGEQDVSKSSENQVQSNEEQSEVKKENDKIVSGTTSDLDDSQNPDDEEDEITEEQLRQCFEKLNCDNSTTENDDILIPEKKNDDSGTEENESDEESDGNDNEDEEDDDDGSSWITPSNVKQVKNSFKGDAEEISKVTVACMSTDFAIQNVLKQMNMNIAALDGRVIKHLRTYILRCYACFKTTSIMTKQFCPNCGNKTLKRVAVSLDENGQQVIHINTRRPLTAKYKNKSIPRFRGGKHSRNPILFEDQPLPREMPSRVAKTKTSALDEDYIAGVSPFVLRDVDSKSALLRSKGNVKQWSKNTQYEEFRRKKYYGLVK